MRRGGCWCGIADDRCKIRAWMIEGYPASVTMGINATLFLPYSWWCINYVLEDFGSHPWYTTGWMNSFLYLWKWMITSNIPPHFLQSCELMLEIYGCRVREAQCFFPPQIQDWICQIQSVPDSTKIHVRGPPEYHPLIHRKLTNYMAPWLANLRKWMDIIPSQWS